MEPQKIEVGPFPNRRDPPLVLSHPGPTSAVSARALHGCLELLLRVLCSEGEVHKEGALFIDLDLGEIPEPFSARQNHARIGGSDWWVWRLGGFPSLTSTRTRGSNPETANPNHQLRAI